jgi:hypothetical protein
MKTALILGCSHAAGSEMTLTDGWKNSYPCLIAKHLGYTVNNRAVIGGSNDAIFRIFESEFKNLDASDIVISCWTGYTRTELWNEDTNTWIAVNLSTKAASPFKEYIKEWIKFQTSDQAGRLNKIKNVLALNQLAQSKNIQVVNIDSFWPVHDFEWPNNIYRPVSYNLWDWALEQKFAKTSNGHFDFNVHKEFATRVLGEMDIISVFETEGGSSILSGPAIKI